MPLTFREIKFECFSSHLKENGSKTIIMHKLAGFRERNAEETVKEILIFSREMDE